MFGKIVDGIMILNDAGKMVDNERMKIPQRFINVQLHEYVVMPNHFHAIMEIVGATLVAQNAGTGNTATILPVPDNDNTGSVSPNDNIVPPNDFIVPPNDFIVPPNDFIVPPNDNAITGEKGQPQGIAPTIKPKTVGDIIGAFQSIVTVEYIRGVKQSGWQSFNGKLWQRNYWEHIIRNEQSYERISQYIINNPKNWNGDKFYND